jgi:glycosyltransferase involved in cell wall biosynthesis
VALLASHGTRVAPIIGLHQVFDKRRDRSASQRLLSWLARLDQRARYYAVSGAAASHWSDFSGVARDRIRIVHNAIAEKFFDPSTDKQAVRNELGVSADNRLVLYVGRLARYKGITTLLDALLPELVRHRLVLAYLGGADLDVDGTDRDIESMRSLIDQHGLGDRVKWLGHRADVARILGAADVLAHPTRMESFGLSLAEALAKGIPIVSSNVEGIPEVLKETDAIQLDPDDVDGFRQAILDVLARPPVERERAAARGIKRAEAFRESRRIDEMVRLFGDRLAGRF